MGTLSPVTADAVRLLYRDLYRHLDEAEFLATTCQEWTEADVATARELIPDLVILIRELLIDHEMAPGGDCRTCASVWPCPVVALIHGLVKDQHRQFVALVRRVDDAQ
jgi:hypothetical protein